MYREMETNRESHCWLFNTYNSPTFSPWLHSTLAELNDKTKTMLKLIEEDADSFAQRAEMYYKKRPELIHMVEDFYRSHRSLAQQYDQLKNDRVVRVKSPLRHSISLPKEDYDDYVFVTPDKAFDTFTDAGYSYEEAAESEVDDPDEVESSYGEMTKLRDELDRLREENEVQREIIKEKEDIVKGLKEEMRKQSGERTILPFVELTNLKDGNKFEKRKAEKNACLEDKLARKEEENMEITRRLEEAKFELVKVREEMRRMEERLESAFEEKEDAIREKDEEKKEAIREMRNELVEKDEEKREAIRQLSVAMEMIREESNVLRKSIMKNSPRKGVIRKGV